MGYDKLNRLISASGPWGSRTLTYDGSGNLKQQGGLVYQYDTQNRLSEVSGSIFKRFAYDAYGNIRLKEDEDFGYDDASNLVCHWCIGDGEGAAKYKYDGNNYRVSIEKNGKITYEFYAFTGQPLVSFAPSEANKLVEYIYLGDKRVAQRVSDNLAASTTTVTATPNPATFGQSVTITVQVSGASIPTGSVKIKNGSTVLTAVNLTNGKATYTSSTLAVGSYSLVAEYMGDPANIPSSSAPYAFMVKAANQTTTSTTLTSAPNPSLTGQNVTLTATVTGSNPTGVVEFRNGATVVGTQTLSAGKATFTTSFASTGANSLTATYVGDPWNASSTSAAVNHVVKSATTTSLSVSPSPSYATQSVTLTATVTGNGTPSGTVTFKDGASTLGIGTVSGNKASFVTTSLSSGTHSLTAIYEGDATNAKSTSTAKSHQVVADGASVTQLVITPSPAYEAQQITLTATVTAKAPTGPVTFKTSTATLGTASLVGNKATLTAGPLAVGSHIVTAEYAGGGGITGSTSTAVTLVVKAKNATTTTLTSNANPVREGAPLTLTATISGGSPTGSVTFKNGTVDIGTSAITAGKATLVITTLPPGTHSLTAVYSGDAANKTSTSAALSQKINAGINTTLSWDSGSGPNPSTVGQSVKLRITVTGGTGSTGPSGTMTFKNGATVLGTAPVTYNSSYAKYWATLDVSTLPVGTHSITAEYAGDASNKPGISPVRSQVVNERITTVLSWDGGGPNPSGVGQSVMLRVAVTGGVAALGPTGNVTFKNGATVLGTAAVTYNGPYNKYWATLNVSTLAVGTHNITAEYAGDVSNKPGMSPVLNQVVNDRVTTVLSWDGGGPNPSTVGQSVMLRIAVAGGVAPIGPTGNVTFKNGATVLGTATVTYNGPYNKYWATLNVSTLPVGTHSITAEYAGDVSNKPGTSPVLSQVVNDRITTTLSWDGGGPNPSTIGQSVMLRVAVAGGTSLIGPTGEVTFKNSGVVIGTAPVIYNSAYNKYWATLNVTSLPLGTNEIIAAYAGDVSNKPGVSPVRSQLVNERVTTTLSWDAIGPNPSTVGQSVMLRVELFGAAAPIGPTGNVTFKNGQTVLGVASVAYSSGKYTAYIQTTSLPVGTNSITAEYAGDTSNKPGVSAVRSQVVNERATTTLTWDYVGPSPSTVGQSVMLRVELLGAAAPVGPTGNVTFKTGQTVLGVAAVTYSSGKYSAYIQTTSLPVGTNSLIAEYAGDVSNKPGVSPARSHVVNDRATTTLTWTYVGPSPSSEGQSVMLRVDLLGAAAPAGPTGNVTFKAGQTVLGVGAITYSSGKYSAYIQTTSIPVGTNSLIAEYAGDVSNKPGVSPARNHVVNERVTTSVMWESPSSPVPTGPNPSTVGQSVTLRVYVVGGTGSIGPTGTVTFKNGATVIGTVPVSFNSAYGKYWSVLTTNTLPVGTQGITAEYSGDTSNKPGISATLSQVVNDRIATTTNWESPSSPTVTGPNPSTVGQMVYLRVFVSGGTGTIGPTGPVTFKNGATTLGSSAVSYNSAYKKYWSVLPISSLPKGTHSITAEYPGDASNKPSTSPVLNQVVN